MTKQHNWKTLPTLKHFLREWCIPVVFVTFYWWLVVSAVKQKTVGMDELGQITSGYSGLKYRDFRLLPQAGLLPMQWAALPLLFNNLTFPSREDLAWRAGNYDIVGYKFLFQSQNNLPEILNKSRAMIALLGAALGLLVYFWSRSIFGRIGATISLALYILFPTSLILGGYVLSDMGVALFFTAATWAMWHSIHKISPFSILASAASVTGLFLSKMSSGLIIPVVVLLLAIRLLLRRPLFVHLRNRYVVNSIKQQMYHLFVALAAQAIVAYVLIWGAYGFRYCAMQNSAGEGEEFDARAWNHYLSDGGFVESTLGILRDQRVLPESFLFGAANMWHHRHTTPDMPRVALMDGKYSLDGFTSYFPRCLLYKTPTGVFVVLSLAALALLAQWMRQRTRCRPHSSDVDTLYQLTPVAVFLFVYWTTAIITQLNFGIRYIFPTYPPAFVLAGASAYWFVGKHRFAQVSLCIALATVAVESFLIRPDYYAYFNMFAGGPRNGYKHFLDQDDGMELPRLKHWLDNNVSAQDPLYLSYMGYASTQYYQIGGYRLPTIHNIAPVEPAPIALTGGVYCISAQNLGWVAPPYIGRWAAPFEQAYQQLLPEIARSKKAGDHDSGGQQEDQKRDAFQLLQFGRLCAYLRQREPDAQIGYSILIYRLTDENVHQALFGPPAELLPQIELKGSQGASR